MGSRPTIPVSSGSGTTTTPAPAVISSGGRPATPAKAGTPLIALIPTSPALFAATTPDFTGYVQQQLGDLGTGTDGWDAIYNPMVTAAAGEVDALGDFDTLLDEMAFNTGDFASTYFAPVDALLPAFLSDGDTLNSGVQNPGTAQGAPTLTAAPSPPASGGSGTGGSGGGNAGGGPDGGGGSGGTGSGSCFSPNVKVKTPTGDVAIGSFVSGAYVLTHFGPRPATLVEHAYNGPMLDMGGGELVTPDHLIRTGAGFEWMDFSPASDIWNSQVSYDGTVYTLHVSTDRTDEHHFRLANGSIAHNKPVEIPCDFDCLDWIWGG